LCIRDVMLMSPSCEASAVVRTTKTSSKKGGRKDGRMEEWRNGRMEEQNAEESCAKVKNVMEQAKKTGHAECDCEG